MGESRRAKKDDGASRKEKDKRRRATDSAVKAREEPVQEKPQKKRPKKRRRRSTSTSSSSSSSSSSASSSQRRAKQHALQMQAYALHQQQQQAMLQMMQHQQVQAMQQWQMTQQWQHAHAMHQPMHHAVQQHQQMLRRGQEEDDRKRRAAEDQKRKEEEAKRASVAITKVIQRLRAATPETLDELKKELSDVLSAELPRTGDQRRKLMEESEKALDCAKKAVTQIKEFRKTRERQMEIEKQKQQIKDRSDSIAERLKDLAGVVPTQAEKLRLAAAPLEQAEACMDDEQVEDTIKAVHASCDEAGRAAAEGLAFLAESGLEIRTLLPTLQGVKPLELDLRISNLVQQLNNLSALSSSMRLVSASARQIVVRRQASRAHQQNTRAVFRKYDRDCDGFLSKKEALRYARNEFGFQMPPEALDRVWQHLVDDGAAGVALDSFQQLKVAVGVAREAERDSRRRRERKAMATEDKEKEVSRLAEEACASEDPEPQHAVAKLQAPPVATAAATLVPKVTAPLRSVPLLAPALPDWKQRSFLGVEPRIVEPRILAPQGSAAFSKSAASPIPAPGLGTGSTVGPCSSDASWASLVASAAADLRPKAPSVLLPVPPIAASVPDWKQRSLFNVEPRLGEQRLLAPQGSVAFSKSAASAVPSPGIGACAKSSPGSGDASLVAASKSAPSRRRGFLRAWSPSPPPDRGGRGGQASTASIVARSAL